MGGKKKVENESIFMQILDKVKAQTNNPAQQPAPPPPTKKCQKRREKPVHTLSTPSPGDPKCKRFYLQKGILLGLQ